jgi:hypothetical protein
LVAMHQGLDLAFDGVSKFHELFQFPGF